ncbi:HigA family addiction module antitoxin [Basfia succiniciproducens]|uniref:Addiction module antidote protein, HigA family n=1 Tax=Basfia succiniciproducens TaxID=653940 RepID=A0A1G5ABV2_9PAST|nr:HigA family addiction module antitoxin [Basfia succiniciproducens]QIM68476.1 addiction module antidote protein, HigA family [Basfia succiniciproducens]SCX75362.1 addiction module antidote protein, HigA family [Basfia succiniciproducens]SEP74808.1 addiction module antidote protein, HigA family [Basfia succiniciproducens]
MSNSNCTCFHLVHPGEILYEEWLKPLGITQFELAQGILLSPRKISEIATGKRPITADVAVRLALFFGTDAESWLNLQSHYDIKKSEEEIKTDIESILDSSIDGYLNI